MLPKEDDEVKEREGLNIGVMTPHILSFLPSKMLRSLPLFIGTGITS